MTNQIFMGGNWDFYENKSKKQEKLFFVPPSPSVDEKRKHSKQPPHLRFGQVFFNKLWVRSFCAKIMKEGDFFKKMHFSPGQNFFGRSLFFGSRGGDRILDARGGASPPSPPSKKLKCRSIFLSIFDQYCKDVSFNAENMSILQDILEKCLSFNFMSSPEPFTSCFPSRSSTYQMERRRTLLVHDSISIFLDIGRANSNSRGPGGFPKSRPIQPTVPPSAFPPLPDSPNLPPPLLSFFVHLTTDDRLPPSPSIRM